MARHSSGGSKKSPALLLVLLVVAGVTIVAWAKSQPAKNEAAKPNETASGSSSKASTFSVHPFVLVNAGGVTLVKKDGTREKTSRDEFAKRYPGASRPIEGADVSTGNVARPSGGADLPTQFVSPDRVYAATLAEPKADGASVINIRRGAGAPQSAAVRTESGAAVKEGVLYGWFDLQHLMLVGSAGGERAAYAVDVNGKARLIATLPNNILALQGRGDALLYTTLQTSDGIEIAPKPPSEMHAVRLSGDELLAPAIQESIVTNIVPGANHYAYTLESGESFVRPKKEGALVRLGRKRPLLFISPDELLLRDGFRLQVLALSTGAASDLGEVPEGAVEAYALPE